MSKVQIGDCCDCGKRGYVRVVVCSCLDTHDYECSVDVPYLVCDKCLDGEAD